MTTQGHTAALDREVRLRVFRTAAETGQVPGVQQVAEAMEQPEDVVAGSFQRLGDGRAVILAPGSSTIWAADPFCAVPSAFHVRARERTYWGICIWDALGIPAALAADATVTAQCGDCCGDELVLEVRGGVLERSEGIVHFAVPAARFWENIAFT